MINKKLKVLIFCIIIVVLFSLFVFRFYSVNKRYPQPVTTSVGLNEPIDYNGYRITAVSSELTPATELTKQGYKMDDQDIFKDKLVLLVKLKVENIGKHTVKSSFVTSALQSEAWWNCMNLDLFYVFNDVETIESMDNADIYTITLPFDVIHEQFKENEWKNVRNRHFDLTLSTYPEKKVIRCY